MYARANEQLTQLLAPWTPDQVEALLRFLTRASTITAELADQLSDEPAVSDSHAVSGLMRTTQARGMRGMTNE